MKRFVLFIAIMFYLVPYSAADEVQPVKPTKKDKCPVCGMFVEKYPNWLAEIVFKDGTYVVFDGTKDMFKYYLNMSKYTKEKTGEDIAAVYVTDYYSTSLLKAEEVYFIIGSDVLGPMGHELIPVKGEDAAKAFLRDHRGEKVLGFHEITSADIP